MKQVCSYILGETAPSQQQRENASSHPGENRETPQQVETVPVEPTELSGSTQAGSKRLRLMGGGG